MEHLVPRLEQVDVEEAVGFPYGLLVHGLQSFLGEQGRQLLQEAVLFQLVSESPHHEELGVDPDGIADQAQLLGADPSGNLKMAPLTNKVSSVKC